MHIKHKAYDEIPPSERAREKEKGVIFRKIGDIHAKFGFFPQYPIHPVKFECFY